MPPPIFSAQQAMSQEDVVVVDDECLLLFVEEVKLACEKVESTMKIRGGPCPLCPFKICRRKRDLMKHLVHAHMGPNRFTEGNKQLRLIRALYCHDKMISNVCMGYLARSAAIIRGNVKTLPSGREANTKLDKAIVTVLDVNGPTYAAKADAQNDGLLRRIGNYYLAMDFANKVFREAVYAAGRPHEVVDRLVKDLVEQGKETYELLPKDTSAVVWYNIFEDLVRSQMFMELKATIRDNMVKRRELEHISLDCTLRVCRTIIGQADYRDPAAVRNAAVFPDGVAKRRILSVVGRTSACVS